MLYPTTIYYKTWLTVLSCFFLVDFYLLSFTVAFNFKEMSRFENSFFYVVQALQLIDMIVMCFTAIRFSEVTEWTKLAIDKEEAQIIKKGGQNKKLAEKREFCENNKFITYQYLTTYFFIDLFALVPALLLEKIDIHFRLFCFFRLAKLNDILDQLERLKVWVIY